MADKDKALAEVLNEPKPASDKPAKGSGVENPIKSAGEDDDGRRLWPKRKKQPVTDTPRGRTGTVYRTPGSKIWVKLLKDAWIDNAMRKKGYRFEYTVPEDGQFPSKVLEEDKAPQAEKAEKKEG